MSNFTIFQQPMLDRYTNFLSKANGRNYDAMRLLFQRIVTFNFVWIKDFMNNFVWIKDFMNVVVIRWEVFSI